MQTATAGQNWTISQHLPRGARGTVATLKLMAMFCKRDAGSTELRATAQKIINNTAGHDFSSEIRALFYFTRDHIKYRKDPVEVERVQDALRTLEFGSGDCDDKVTLLVTLLAVCGHRARFCVSGSAPGNWTHVYCEVATPTGWLPLDPTPEQAQPGWETKAPAKGIFEIWPATSANIRIVRAQPSRIVKGSSLRRQVRQRSVASFSSCLSCECEEFGMGADSYEWKMNKGSGECELTKKKCGVFCKIGRGFKAAGKVALAAAPIALAPFTGGMSLAAQAAIGGGFSAAQAVVARYAPGVPAGSNVEDPKGECAAWIQRKQQQETAKAQQAAEAAAAATKAEQDTRIKSEARKLADKEEKGNSGGGLLSQPLLLVVVAIGGLLLLRR